jgi:hypothetical protein
MERAASRDDNVRGLMLRLFALSFGGIVALTGCGGGGDSATSTTNEPAPGLVPFTPPSPLGCDGARAYDACLAFDNQTPFAAHVLLPREVPAGTVVAIHFKAPPGSSATVPEFSNAKVRLLAARSALALYFQVFPARYVLEVGVDADGDGDPEGAGDFRGSTSFDVASDPVATTFSVGLP